MFGYEGQIKLWNVRDGRIWLTTECVPVSGWLIWDGWLCLKLNKLWNLVCFDYHDCLAKPGQFYKTNPSFLENVKRYLIIAAYEEEMCLIPCPVDCVMSDWSQWTDCSTSCGTGSQMRYRHIKQNPSDGGSLCPSLDNARKVSIDVFMYVLLGLVHKWDTDTSNRTLLM